MYFGFKDACMHANKSTHYGVYVYMSSHLSLYVIMHTQVTDTSIFGEQKKVVVTDEIFDVIKNIHEKSAAHSGARKTYNLVCYIVNFCLFHLIFC